MPVSGCFAGKGLAEPGGRLTQAFEAKRHEHGNCLRSAGRSIPRGGVAPELTETLCASPRTPPT